MHAHAYWRDPEIVAESRCRCDDTAELDKKRRSEKRRLPLAKATDL